MNMYYKSTAHMLLGEEKIQEICIKNKLFLPDEAVVKKILIGLDRCDILAQGVDDHVRHHNYGEIVASHIHNNPRHKRIKKTLHDIRILMHYVYWFEKEQKEKRILQ